MARTRLLTGSNFLVIASPNSNQTLVVTYAPYRAPDGMLTGYGAGLKTSPFGRLLHF